MNKIKIRVKGKNIERFIKRLVSFEIELYKIEYKKYNEVYLIISKNDYNQILELKTIYEIEVIELYGINKVKNILKIYKYILISLLVSFIFILYLSNTILSVDVIHSDKEIRELITNELREKDVKVYALKKSYKYLSKVKEEILEKYKDKIEWLEIENSGTKYIVRVEERKIEDDNDDNENRNLVAKKDAIIISVEATSGEIKKYRNDYVKKGDVIISGNIYLNEEVKDQVGAKGTVYGEVWYKATVEYPLTYKEERTLNDEANIYIFKIGNYSFNLNRIKNYNVVKSERTLLKHLFLPILLVKQTNKKVEYIEQKLTVEEATNKAIEYAKEKMLSKLNDNEYIISVKKLKVEENNSKIVLGVFFSVCENITDYENITTEEKIEGE